MQILCTVETHFVEYNTKEYMNRYVHRERKWKKWKNWMKLDLDIIQTNWKLKLDDEMLKVSVTFNQNLFHKENYQIGNIV